jgi:hypothetical protein
MIAALSSAFRQAVKRSNKTGMTVNPCLGMEKLHEADPNANREWHPGDWTIVERVPMEIKIPLMLARYVGMRGQTIVVVSWRQYVDHHLTGKTFRFLPAKTDRTNTIALVPVMPELQDLLAALKVRTKDGPIALRDNGKPWESEVEMQTRVSHWLRDRERDGQIGAGTTLHGLRSTYAAWLAGNHANPKEVTAALGDKSERMGIHYTRHVEAEANVVRRSNGSGASLRRTRTEHDSSNAGVWVVKRGKPVARKTEILYANQRSGRGGTGRRKGLKIPRWQRRVGSSPTARTRGDFALGSPHSFNSSAEIAEWRIGPASILASVES